MFGRLVLHHPRRLYCFISRVPLTRIVSFPPTTNRPFSTSSYFMSALSSHEPSQRACGLDDVNTRPKSTSCVGCRVQPTPDASQVQTTSPVLPDVPRIPPKKRTFHLNNEDLESLVRPLLSCHWHVARVGDGVDRLEVFSLNKLFSFKDFRSAVEFFDALAVIQDEENHHARITVDYADVHLSAHTHVAYQNVSDPGVDAKPVRVPGLTSRDVRFAVKVEQLHGTFLRDARAITKVPADAATLQARSMEQLQQRYPAHSHE